MNQNKSLLNLVPLNFLANALATVKWSTILAEIISAVIFTIPFVMFFTAMGLFLYNILYKEFPELRDILDNVAWEGCVIPTIAFLPFMGLFLLLIGKPVATLFILATAAPLTVLTTRAIAQSIRRYEKRILVFLPSHKRTLRRLLHLPIIALPVFYIAGVLSNLLVMTYPPLYDSPLLVILFTASLASASALPIYSGCLGAINYIRNVQKREHTTSQTTHPIQR